MGKVLIFGGEGQLGLSIADAFNTEKTYVIPHSICDITRPEEIIMQDIKCGDIVINCAAVHDIKDCQKHPSKAWSVNATGCGLLASMCQWAGANYFYISTDYVFPGRSEQPYQPTEEIFPIQSYGRSKAAGEMATLMFGGCVVRVSSLYGRYRCRAKTTENIVNYFANALRQGVTVRAYNNTLRSFTNCDMAAQRIKSLALNGDKGIHHASDAGYASHYTLALHIADCIGADRSLVDQARMPYINDDHIPVCTPLASMRDACDWRTAVSQYLAPKG